MEDLDLNKLLKLLESSENQDLNDPFLLFLNANNLKKGTHYVDLYYLFELFEFYNKEKIKIFKTTKICKEHFEILFIEKIPYIRINIREKYLKNRNKVLTDNKRFFYNAKRKYELFLNKNGIKKGNFKILEQDFYNYYIGWCIETNKRRKLRISEQLFKSLNKLYFTKRRKYYLVNKELCQKNKKSEICIHTPLSKKT